MAQNASVNKRSGDEYYTKSETIHEIIKRYRDIFENFDYIWIPFNSDNKSIYTEFVKEFGKEKILTLPESCYNPEIGIKDFFKWGENKNFFDLIAKN